MRVDGVGGTKAAEIVFVVLPHSVFTKLGRPQQK
jgi:hypothetical protein